MVSKVKCATASLLWITVDFVCLVYRFLGLLWTNIWCPGVTTCQSIRSWESRQLIPGAVAPSMKWPTYTTLNCSKPLKRPRLCMNPTSRLFWIHAESSTIPWSKFLLHSWYTQGCPSLKTFITHDNYYFYSFINELARKHRWHRVSLGDFLHTHVISIVGTLVLMWTVYGLRPSMGNSKNSSDCISTQSSLWKQKYHDMFGKITIGMALFVFIPISYWCMHTTDSGLIVEWSFFTLLVIDLVFCLSAGFLAVQQRNITTHRRLMKLALVNMHSILLRDW